MGSRRTSPQQKRPRPVSYTDRMFKLTLADGKTVESDDWRDLLVTAAPNYDPEVTLEHLANACLKTTGVDVRMGQNIADIHPHCLLARLHECMMIQLTIPA